MPAEQPLTTSKPRSTPKPKQAKLKPQSTIKPKPKPTTKKPKNKGSDYSNDDYGENEEDKKEDNDDDDGDDEDCVCPRLFAPVCGDDGESHSNVCEAQCAGAEVLCDGECPCNGDYSSSTSCDVDDVKPVCGNNNKTYSNECIMRCNNAEKQCDGECPCCTSDPDEMWSRHPFCECVALCLDEEQEPVCAGNGETYSSRCLASCANFWVKCEGPCPCETSPHEPIGVKYQRQLDRMRQDQYNVQDQLMKHQLRQFQPFQPRLRRRHKYYNFQNQNQRRYQRMMPMRQSERMFRRLRTRPFQ